MIFEQEYRVGIEDVDKDPEMLSGQWYIYEEIKSTMKKMSLFPLLCVFFVLARFQSWYITCMFHLKEFKQP